MGNKLSFLRHRISDVSKGQPFVMHPAELIASAAWRARSIHVVRLLDRLELEHMAHAGCENGMLIATYDQLVEYGIGRRFIRRAIEEAGRLGLIEAKLGLYRGAARTAPSRFRLTYLRSKVIPGDGTAAYYVAPTHEWRRYGGAAEKSIRLVVEGEPSSVHLRRPKPEFAVSEGSQPRRIPRAADNRRGARR
jgi:hypothetical protein